MKVGLRIDVDTLRGTRRGIPSLCDTLGRHGVHATFFVSVGPDNMGRHLWRLFRPAFLLKMLRSRAPSLYGWDILLHGTFWPGTVIGRAAADALRRPAAEGHEVGLHAWDHHAWQSHIARMDTRAITADLDRACRLFTEVLGAPPACSAAPGWRCTNAVLQARDAFPFQYNSDCRGNSIFLPQVDGKPLRQPQVPTTLPTYDEIAGRQGISDRNYNEHILSLLKPHDLNVLTIHAEVEGGALAPMFHAFLDAARARGIHFVPLGKLVAAAPHPPPGRICQGEIAGREGWVAIQGSKPTLGGTCS
jgi:undecaprenyl phosphate-alpha-L-ara4FN deformylase